MPTRTFSALCGAATLAVGFALWAPPVQAGFQWSEPKESSAYLGSASQDISVSPGIVSGPEGVSPVISGAPVYPSAPSLSSVGGARDKYDLATETISMSPVLASPLGAPGAPPVGGEVVQGFATRVPLALALRQILPGNYNFSLDPGIDANTLVSYKGGRPWGETLKGMLSSVGLDYRLAGTVVTVAHASVAPPTVDALPAPGQSPSLQVQPLRYMQPTALPRVRDAQVVTASPEKGAVNTEGWSANRGETLRKVLSNWCSRAGVELKWLSEYDYPIEASAHFSGGFEEAVRSLFSGFDSARPQPIGELHVNPRAGQDVLVVQARGNSYTN